MAKLCMEPETKMVSIPFVISSEEGEHQETADAKGRGLVSLLLVERLDVFIGKRSPGVYRFILSCLPEKAELVKRQVEKFAKLKGLRVEEKN